MKVTFSVKAYSKILLHACKYPHKAVNGVLISDSVPNGTETIVVDAIPLFHQCLGLAPMLEVALAQIDAYCRSNKLQIAGYYQANENFNFNEPDLVAYKIAEKLQEHANHTFLVMVDNTKMGAECEDLALKLYISHESKWKQKDGNWNLQDGDAGLAIVSELIRSKAYQTLSDFDNHLDDITQDWLNPSVNKLLLLPISK
ncbi:ER membrane protein complex subunit 8-like [Rhopilema esculentum]|uniref:ER membrane protein complex subunit 8-like n=1 Tax=Rhopilema esculentum TaxID=499914 RepID=UPI0031D3BC90